MIPKLHTRFTALLFCASGALALAGCEGPNLFTGPGLGGDDDDPPRVVAVDVPEFVRPNDVLRVEIRAVAPAGITQVDVTLVESVVRERTLEVDPPDPDVEVLTEFQLPSPLVRESVLVQVEVQDADDVRSETFEVEVPVVQDDGGDV